MSRRITYISAALRRPLTRMSDHYFGLCVSEWQRLRRKDKSATMRFGVLCTRVGREDEYYDLKDGV